jgi:membrane protease YdiL (CAAX protease family)
MAHSPYWAGIDITVLLLGSIAYVLAVVARVRPRYLIAGTTAVALGYGSWVCVRDHEALQTLGLRWDNLDDCLAWLGPATLLAALALVAYGRWTRRAVWSRRILLAVPLYVLWGFVQQWLFQAVLNRGLQELIDTRWAVVALVSGVFSAVHAPRWWLVILTAIIGPVWAAVYLMTPNLFALALSHALLGGLAYYCVRGEDPWDDL